MKPTIKNETGAVKMKPLRSTAIMYKFIAKGLCTAAPDSVRRHLSMNGFHTHGSFFALSASLPISDIAVACMALVNDDFDAFYLEKSRAALEDINAKLDEINTIMPNTYDYFQGKAYYYVASNSDIASAKECIKMCKLDKKRNSWRYSEAFLAAYEGRAAMSIYKKYSQAFHYDQDLNRIVDYIEYILEKEPDKVGLHLAAGLVYNEIDQKSLAKEHLDCYFAVSADDRIRRVFADKKIWKEDKAA